MFVELQCLGYLQSHNFSQAPFSWLSNVKHFDCPYNYGLFGFFLFSFLLDTVKKEIGFLFLIVYVKKHIRNVLSQLFLF